MQTAHDGCIKHGIAELQEVKAGSYVNVALFVVMVCDDINEWRAQAHREELFHGDRLP